MCQAPEIIFLAVPHIYEKDGAESSCHFLALSVTGPHGMNWVSQSASFPEL